LTTNLNLKNNSFKQFLLAHDLTELDQGLLRQAFTHSSVGKKNNERLEFLGDAVLDSVLSEYLYLHLPNAQENYMTRLRAHLVNKQALASLANQLELYNCIILGAGEKQTGGHKRDSNLADAFEALLGAILLSGGYSQVKAFILKVYQNEFAQLPTENSLKDPKTQLQEFLQKNALELPHYKILSEEGKPHNRTFTVFGETKLYQAQAKGKSRKQAEQRVAELLLEKYKLKVQIKNEDI